MSNYDEMSIISDNAQTTQKSIQRQNEASFNNTINNSNEGNTYDIKTRIKNSPVLLGKRNSSHCFIFKYKE